MEIAKQLEKFLTSFEGIDEKDIAERADVQLFVSSLMISIADSFFLCDGRELATAVVAESQEPGEILFRATKVIHSYASHAVQLLYGEKSEKVLRSSLLELLKWTHFLNSHLTLPSLTASPTDSSISRPYQEALIKFVTWLNDEGDQEIPDKIKAHRFDQAKKLSYFEVNHTHPLQQILSEKRASFPSIRLMMSPPPSDPQSKQASPGKMLKIDKKARKEEAIKRTQVVIDGKKELLSWAFDTFFLVTNFAQIEPEKVELIVKLVVYVEAGDFFKRASIDTKFDPGANFSWFLLDDLLSRDTWNNYLLSLENKSQDEKLKDLESLDVFLHGLLKAGDFIVRATCTLEDIKIAPLMDHDVTGWLNSTESQRHYKEKFTEAERVLHIESFVAEEHESTRDHFVRVMSNFAAAMKFTGSERLRYLRRSQRFGTT